MIISYVETIAFQSVAKFMTMDIILRLKRLFLYNKQKFMSNTRNKFGISEHPGIIIYIFSLKDKCVVISSGNHTLVENQAGKS